MKRSARAVAGGAVGICLVSWAFSACLSPTLPLPPPGEPSLATLNADGHSVRIEGTGAIPGSNVIATNQEPSILGRGGVTTADGNGAYAIDPVPVDLSVHPTNVVRIWQTFGSDISDFRFFEVPKGVRFGAAPVGDDGGAPDSEAGPGDAGGSDSAE